MQPDFFAFSKNISVTLLGEAGFFLQIYKIMENNELVFLQECQKELAEMKERIAALEARIAGIQASQAVAGVPEEADEVDFTGVELGVADIPAPAEEPVAEPVAPVAEPVPVVEPEPMAQAEPATQPEPAAPVQEDDTANLPWRKDNPGMMVKNIRSGISLLDRAQFIGTLFKEDFTLYDNTIAELNNMNSLDEAVAYIKEHFPEWNMNSDVVYRFMMAIRKKLG
jgi:hypothetical protein